MGKIGVALSDDLTFDADLDIVGEACGVGDEVEEKKDDEEDGAALAWAATRCSSCSSGTAACSPGRRNPQRIRLRRRSYRRGRSTSLLGSAAAGTPWRAGADAKKAISDAILAELALVRLLGNVTLWVDRWNSFGIWINLKLDNF